MKNFCEKCGAKLPEGAAFCSKCGASTGVQTGSVVQPVQEKKNGKKAVVISIAAAVVLILVVAGAALYLHSDGYQCKKNMKLAEESYEAEEYKKALSYYKKALALDDTLVEAYVKSADIYLTEESFEDARKILKKGIKKIDDEESIDTLNDKLAEVYLSEAEVYLDAGNYEQAIATLKTGQEDVGENNALLENRLARYVYLAEASLNKAGNDTDSSDADDSKTDGNDTADSRSGAAEYGSGTITIWVADTVADFTKSAAEDFIAANPDYSDYRVIVEPVGEYDAAGTMIIDTEDGADIYGFAQDQITRLVSADALAPVVGDNASFVYEQNDAGAASAAMVGGTTYAYPMTSDNGYLLYYDSSVVTDPASLEQIVADCEAAGKNFYMEINSGWYQPAFFFATGCTLTYDMDDDGNFTGCDIDYASDAGLVALKEMIELASSSAFQNGSSVDYGTNIGAIVDGTWDAEAAKAAFGDSYACAKLPSFKGSDGKTYQLSGFGGFRLLGVRPQEDAGKLAVCHALAQYLTSTEVQLARYQEAGYGPSNLAAQQDSAVQSDEALSALMAQLAYSIPQGNYPYDYWMCATALGDDIITGSLNVFSSDNDLTAALQDFQDACISYAW